MSFRKMSQREARTWKRKAIRLQSLLRDLKYSHTPGDRTVSVLHITVNDEMCGRLSMADDVGRMLVARSRGFGKSVQVFAVEIPRDLMEG